MRAAIQVTALLLLLIAGSTAYADIFNSAMDAAATEEAGKFLIPCNQIPPELEAKCGGFQTWFRASFMRAMRGEIESTINVSTALGIRPKDVGPDPYPGIKGNVREACAWLWVQEERTVDLGARHSLELVIRVACIDRFEPSDVHVIRERTEAILAIIRQRQAHNAIPMPAP